MVGQEEDEGRLEDTTEIDNAGEMILLEKAAEEILIMQWEASRWKHNKDYIEKLSCYAGTQ